MGKRCSVVAAQVAKHDVCFAVVGDFGTGPDVTDDWQTHDTRPLVRKSQPVGYVQVADLVRSWAVDFVLTTGDNNYSVGSKATIDAHVGRGYHWSIAPYQGKYGRGANENAFFPALGNHDWGDSEGRGNNIDAHEEFFPALNDLAPGNGRYYEVRRGPVACFALDR